MRRTSFILFFVLLCTVFLYRCKDDDPVIEIPTDEEFLLTREQFNAVSLVSFEMVTSTLEDGTTADCFRLTFNSNPVPVGPFCPETIDDNAGLGVYDGATNPGLRVFGTALLNDIEADGYNMVNADGTVNVDRFDGAASREVSNCLEAAPDDDLLLVFTIPARPVLSGTTNDIGEVELTGLSLDGVPINGNPPSAINGPVMGPPGTGSGYEINFPSLDPCGGHHDPAGYYHWHFVPQVMNQVLEANGITEVSCTVIDQTQAVQLFGFAKDGFPIYAYAEEPSGLDECGGWTATTPEYPNGTYHYVASTMTAPNIPRCLVGVAAARPFVIQ